MRRFAIFMFWLQAFGLLCSLAAVGLSGSVSLSWDVPIIALGVLLLGFWAREAKRAKVSRETQDKPLMTEDKPHVVYPKDAVLPADVLLFASYAEAHEFWLARQPTGQQWLVATLGRVIDPSAPIIDVNE
ncbi:MAG TPA: hypothetical protein VEA41_23325 [Salinarimonas sp.]|nr:hypothetical protein [Salinarimonas sp.]